MFNLTINEDDKKWLHSNYPSLKISKDRSGITKLEGILKFDMVYYGGGEGQTIKYVINPNAEHITRGQRIQDDYQIEIVLKSSEHSDLPQVYEKAGRINSVGSNRKVKLADLHINPSGAACFCLIFQEKDYLPSGFNLPDFFHNLVIPFFYSQSYFEKHGSWPWGQYGHGICGPLEWYSSQSDLSKERIEIFLGYLRKLNDWQSFQSNLAPKKKVKGHQQCWCGSSMKLRDCHKKALSGIWKLKEDIVANQIGIG